MARGGPRPGAGRPRGAKGKKRPIIRKVQRIVVDDYASSVAPPANDTPLGYMLQVMMDPAADDDRRDKMAMAAAPFMHARLAPSSPSKKDEAKDAAARVGKSDRLATPSTPPKLVVNNR